ncbi:MAG: glycerate kinase [Microlunatus sp.]
MRVLICPDRMGPLSSASAGRAMATGWPGAEVVAVGEAGFGVVEATADGWGVPLQTGVLDGALFEWAVTDGRAVLGLRGPSGPPAADSPIPYRATSLPLGRAVATVLTEHRPRQLVVDLAGLDCHDGGAGLLAGLGATAKGAELTAGVAGLTGIEGIELAPVHAMLASTELVGLVPSPQRDAFLLGLRGITSRRGHAAREDAARLLTTDAALQRLTGLVSAEIAAAPGAGACGGLGWAVLALGGRLATGPELALTGARGPYDLVVTGCGLFDFATRGGGVVAAAAELAAEALAPCVVVAGEVLIGSREMRTMGIEAAYPIRESHLDRPAGGDLGEAELIATVTRISRTWRW